MSDRTIYGWWLIVDRETEQEVSRIAAHHPPGSSAWNKADDGLLYKVDYERFWSEWVDA